MGKRLWETEVCNVGGTNDGWGLAAQFSKMLHDAMTVIGCNSFHYWMTIWSDQEGVTRSSGNGFIRTQWAYAFGHYSKFVRPGWHMIGVAPYAQNSGNLNISAYKDPATGKFAIVVLNTGIDKPGPAITLHLQGFTPSAVTPYWTSGEDLSVKMRKQTDIPVTNGTFIFTIPNVSIMTFVGQGTPTPASAPALALPAAEPPLIMISKHLVSLTPVKPGPYAVELTDATGRILGIWHGIGSGAIALDCGVLTPGVYCVRMDAGAQATRRTICIPR
jgi:glucuronoarabinoxylan endo-1,4-beta-xylanase